MQLRLRNPARRYDRQAAATRPPGRSAPTKADFASLESLCLWHWGKRHFESWQLANSTFQLGREKDAGSWGRSPPTVLRSDRKLSFLHSDNAAARRRGFRRSAAMNIWSREIAQIRAQTMQFLQPLPVVVLPCLLLSFCSAGKTRIPRAQRPLPQHQKRTSPAFGCIRIYASLAAVGEGLHACRTRDQGSKSRDNENGWGCAHWGWACESQSALQRQMKLKFCFLGSRKTLLMVAEAQRTEVWADIFAVQGVQDHTTAFRCS